LHAGGKRFIVAAGRHGGHRAVGTDASSRDDLTAACGLGPAALDLGLDAGDAFRDRRAIERGPGQVRELRAARALVVVPHAERLVALLAGRDLGFVEVRDLVADADLRKLLLLRRRELLV